MPTIKHSDWIKKQKASLLVIARKSPAALAAKVVKKTPVDTGVLRGSWTASLNNPIANNVHRGERNPQAYTVSSRLGLNDEFYYMNGQHYARKIEYGYSKQAPNGMLRTSVAEWQQIVNGVVRGI
jgi:hypothetical protein